MKKYILTELQVKKLLDTVINEQLAPATQRAINNKKNFQGKSPLKPAEPLIKIPSGGPMPGTKPTTMSTTTTTAKNPAPIVTIDKKYIITFDTNNVTNIQRALNINPTGVWDSATKNAVMGFQKTNNIKPTGYVNKATAMQLKRTSEAPVVTMFKPNPDYAPPTISATSKEQDKMVSTPDAEIPYIPQKTIKYPNGLTSLVSGPANPKET